MFSLFGPMRAHAADNEFSGNIVIKNVNTPTLVLQQVPGGGFPPQKWNIAGDEFRFYLYDGTNLETPLLIEAGAPTHSLYVDSMGRMGVGTASLAADLHVLSGDLDAELLLESPDTIFGDGHSWKLSSNPFTFAIKDVTGNRTPFVVEDHTPNNTLYLADLGSGHVGIGTNTPDLIGSVSTGGNARHLNLDAGTGQARAIVQGNLGAELYMVHKGGSANRKTVRFGVNGGKYRIACVSDDLQSNTESAAFCIDMATTNVGIKTPNPTKPLQVGDAGTNDGNGAHVTAGGVWTNASSRSVKDDIQLVSLDTARETIRALQPVTYRYKNERDEQYVGFIAEDVPDLVATNDRKSLASMDITAVLTRVVQDQDRELAEQRRIIAEQRELNSQQERARVQQESVLLSLSKRLADLEKKSGETEGTQQAASNP